jgi:hypothetical protein
VSRWAVGSGHTGRTSEADVVTGNGGDDLVVMADAEVVTGSGGPLLETFLLSLKLEVESSMLDLELEEVTGGGRSRALEPGR